MATGWPCGILPRKGIQRSQDHPNSPLRVRTNGRVCSDAPQNRVRAGWKNYQAYLDQPPIIEGTIIKLHVERLPGDRDPKPVWLWASKPIPDSNAEVDHWWAMFISRFDLEHTFRFLKQTLGWTRSHLRSPAAADRWTWLIIAAHAQLRLARPVASDYRLPWQKPLAPTMLTPVRV